jgi:hypothetical protein
MEEIKGKTVKVRNKKTGLIGYIGYFSDENLIGSKEYYARFRSGETRGYAGGKYKGSELELIDLKKL